MTACTVLTVTRVVDGDTVRLTRTRDLGTADGLAITATDTTDIPVRLVHVDTPERGEVGWADAKRDLEAWIEPFRYDGDEVLSLTLHTTVRDNFGRLLGDLHAPDGDTASLHLIRDKGWPTWSETR
jgi:endonuclease YncB( thermonuclease family)